MTDSYGGALRRRLVEGQVNGTGSRAAVQPAIGVDANRLARELLEVAWLVDRLEQR
jgi:hypothetical protein